MKSIKGKIISGTGAGAKIMQDYLQKFKDIFKLSIFPGTLNLQLEKEFDLQEPKQNEKTKQDSASSLCWEGYIDGFTKPDGTKRGGVYFLKAKIKNIPVFIIRPVLTKHPKNIIELIAPINIRKQYGLKDGDLLEVYF